MENGQISTGSSATDWYRGQAPFLLRANSTTELAAVAYGPNFVAGPGDNGDAKAFAASYTLANTDSTINASGEEQAAPSASTLYHVYYCASNAGDPPVANTLRLSTSAPMSYFGQYVLENSTSFGQQSPFLGLVLTNGSTEFEDSESFRGVLSYYVRRQKAIRLRPGYVDDNAQTNLAALNNAAYARINGGTGDTATYLTFGEEDVHFSATWCTNAAIAAVCFVGIGDNSNTQPSGGAVFGVAAIAKTCVSAHAIAKPTTMESRTVTMLANTSSVPVTFVSDSGRGGAAADVPQTYLVGMLRG